MKESNFKFSNPRIIESEFFINDSFEEECFDGFGMNTTINNKVNKDKTEAIVSLEIIIGEKDENYPFYLRVVNQAHFSCDDPEKFEKLIRTNAPALLLSYIRPYVSFITSQAGINPFHIPFMNFTKQNDTSEDAQE